MDPKSFSVTVAGGCASGIRNLGSYIVRKINILYRLCVLYRIANYTDLSE